MGTNLIGDQTNNGNIKSMWTRQLSQMVAQSCFRNWEVSGNTGNSNMTELKKYSFYYWCNFAHQ